MDNSKSREHKIPFLKLVFLFVFIYGLAHLSPNGYLQNISIFSFVGPQASYAQDEEEGGIARGEEWGYAYPSSPLRMKILDLLRVKRVVMLILRLRSG